MQSSRRHALGIVRRALVALLVLSVTPAATPSLALAADVRPTSLRVCIDPGHGGGYSGAYYGGVSEKSLNLKIAKALAKELKRRGVAVTLTRSSDRKVYSGGGLATWRWDGSAYRYISWPTNSPADRLRLDLQARANAANKAGADLFVSIHCNAAGSSARGIEVWSAPNDPLGERFAADVLSGAVRRTGAKNRGVHKANFYVTRWSNTPAVLVESGFISNSGERGRLRSASYRAKLARGIADGIVGFSKRPVSEPYDRIAGRTRWDTAAALAQRSHPTTASAVVLASGEGYADSLVAGPLAAKLEAPILTTRAKFLPAPIRAELIRLKPQRIIVVGGPVAVSDEVVKVAALSAGIKVSQVERLGGRSRYDVALAVARAVDSSGTAGVVISSGVNWADALSIGGSASERGEPILLMPPGGLTNEQYRYVGATESSRTITVVGGPRAVPASGMRGLSFERLWGRNRYETNWAVMKARYSSDDMLQPMFASGEVFADALVVGPYAAAMSRPVFLVGKSTVGSPVRPWVYQNRKSRVKATVIGGTAAVSAYVAPSHEKWRMNRH